MVVEAVLSGDRLSLARLITGVENRDKEALKALEQLFLRTGKAHLIGITGSPGTGKSSLVNQLVRLYRHPPGDVIPKRVAVVAVDPSSPFTGGALLGDRVRMRDLAGDPGVFIRSMASRGILGGLAATTSLVVQVLDAAGFEVIMIETVGVGQSEMDIARLAHTVVVVEAPGMGDDIQAGKAGILEIADILVINKADQAGADYTQRALNQMLDIAFSDGVMGDNGMGPFDIKNIQHRSDQGVDLLWRPPIIKTVATVGEGIDQLYGSLLSHHEFLKRSGGWTEREKKRLTGELDFMLQETLVARWRNRVPDTVYNEVLARLLERRLSPMQAVSKLVETE